MRCVRQDVRALAEQSIGLLQSAPGPFDEGELFVLLDRLVLFLSSSSSSSLPVSSSSPRAAVRVRDSPARKAGGMQSKSVALPSSSFARGSSDDSAGPSLRVSGSLLAVSPPLSPPATKQRSGSVWSASPQVERKASSPTPTLGRHKIPQSPSLARSPSEPLKAAVASLCSSCNLRAVCGPCSECGEGQCVNVACAGLYMLKSLGETQKRVICKRCVEKLKQVAATTRAAQSAPSSDAKGGEEEDGADNPMFLAARRRRNKAGADSDNETGNAKKEGQPEDQDDPFENFSWDDDND